MQTHSYTHIQFMLAHALKVSQNHKKTHHSDCIYVSENNQMHNGKGKKILSIQYSFIFLLNFIPYGYITY